MTDRDEPGPAPAEIEADRYRVLSRLADDLSHEVKNPLHAMVINLELVKRRVADGSADLALERVAVVQEQVGRVHELVEALIRILRPSRDGASYSDVAQVLEDLLPLMRVEARLAYVRLDVEPEAAGREVALPADQLRHVLLTMVDQGLSRARGLSGAAVRVTVSEERGAAAVRVAVHAADGERPLAAAAEGAEGPERLRIPRALAAAAGGAIEEEEAAGDGSVALVLRLPRRGPA